MSDLVATVRLVDGVHDVSDWEVVRYETIGRNPKIWLRPAGAPTHSHENDWLFKPVITHPDGRVQGEDWAERVAAEVAGMLGVRCAEVRLAEHDGVPGSISRNVAPDGWNLVLGSVLLTTVVPGYVEGSEHAPGRPGHRPDTIAEALAMCSSHGGMAPVDEFAGFLVLDAFVGNRDRHDQNWAALRQTTTPGGLELAPSFDHASGLGFGETDERRARLLEAGRLRAWSLKGTAHRFEHDPDGPKSAVPDLVSLARSMLELAGSETRRYWYDRLLRLDMADVEDVVRSVPRMSAPAATFAVELLRINLGRLLDER